MQITSDQAYDMLPYVVDIYDELKMTEYINKVRKENKGKGLTQIQAAEKAIKHIIRNSPKYKKEFFSIIGIAEGKTAEEVSAQPFYKTMNTFKEIYKDKDLVDFFKSAIG